MHSNVWLFLGAFPRVLIVELRPVALRAALLPIFPEVSDGLGANTHHQERLAVDLLDPAPLQVQGESQDSVHPRLLRLLVLFLPSVHPDGNASITQEKHVTGLLAFQPRDKV